MARNKLLIVLLSMMLATGAAVAAHDEGDDDDGSEHDEEHASDHDDGDDGDDGDDHDGEDPDDERGSDEGGESERRRIEVETDDEGVSFELERETRATEDKIEAGFDFEDATFEVEYEAEEGGNETELSLEVQFQTLVEYRDTDGDGRYSPGDEVVSAYALGDESEDFDVDGRATWQTPTVSDIAQDNKTGKRIDAPAAIGNGTFGLRFYVFGDFVDLGDASLEPTSIKVDIIIEDYPYQADDTALALILETESKSEFERDHDDLDDDEDGVAAGARSGTRNVSLVFSWKTFADVDGVSTDVHTTTLGSKQEMESDEDGSERKVEGLFALSYARGDRIVHDPESRLSIQSGTGATVDVPAPGMLLAVGVLAAVAVARRRL